MSVLPGFQATTVHNSRTLPVGAAKGSQKVLSVLTLDWTGVTAEQMQELAALHCKTRIQNERRVAEVDNPKEETVLVTNYCLHQGRKAKGMTKEDAIKVLLGQGMSKEELFAMLNKAQED